jgi:hypothetical protein
VWSGRWRTVCCCRSWVAWSRRCPCSWPPAARCNIWGIEGRRADICGRWCCCNDLAR